MLHALVLAIAKESAELIARFVQQTGHIQIDGMFAPVESSHTLTRALNRFSPDLAFVEMGDERNAALCGLVRDKAPEATMVGFSTQEPAMVDPLWPNAPDHTSPVQPWPLTPESLMRVCRRAVEMRLPKAFENLIAMMPAKAGCGASTTILNVAGQLASQFQRHVLLIEGDLRSGTLADALGVTPSCSISKTLAVADTLQSLLWSQHVVEAGGIDLMPAARGRAGELPQWYSYLRLLKYVTPKYDPVLVDLPEVVNDATAEVVRLARSVYVVVTPELPALQLARSRIAELDSVLEDPARIRIILNRWHRAEVGPHDVAQVLGREVEAVLPNDYPGVKKSILRNSYVESTTPLGKAYRALAGFLIGVSPPPVVEVPKSKLLAALLPPHVQTRRRSA